MFLIPFDFVEILSNVMRTYDISTKMSALKENIFPSLDSTALVSSRFFAKTAESRESRSLVISVSDAFLRTSSEGSHHVSADVLKSRKLPLPHSFQPTP